MEEILRPITPLEIWFGTRGILVRVYETVTTHRLRRMIAALAAATRRYPAGSAENKAMYSAWAHDIYLPYHRHFVAGVCEEI